MGFGSCSGGRRIMKTKMESFLGQGVSLYSEAQTTILAFESEMKKVLRTAVEGRTRWTPLTNHRIHSPSFGGGSGDWSWWGCISIDGRSPRRGAAEIDCGLWWNSPASERPIIYASFYIRPKSVLAFSWNRRDKHISSFNRFGRTFLYLPFFRTTEIKDSLNCLLDALLSQL
jgi:hypothetical protein